MDTHREAERQRTPNTSWSELEILDARIWPSRHAADGTPSGGPTGVGPTPRSDPPSRRGLEGLVERLKRRKLVQWMVAYCASSWFVLQSAELLGEIWMWPAAYLRVLSLVLGLGLLPAGVVAWYHGERGRQRACCAELVILTALACLSAFVLLSFDSAVS